MHKHNYSLEVLVNGRPAQEYYRDAKAFIEARDGTEYTLRFRNNNYKRVMAVFSVDGIEVLKGKVASQADNGYIVEAFSNIEIKGYRIDERNVAAFKFGRHGNSYAVTVGGERVDQQTGEVTQDKTVRNNGVIGVRVFEEDVGDKDYLGSFKPRSLSGGNFSTSLSTTYVTGGVGPAVLHGLNGYSGFPLAVSGCCSARGVLRSIDINKMGQLSAVSHSILDRNEQDNGGYTSSVNHQTACYVNSSEYIAAAVPQASYTCAVPAPTPSFDVGTAWGTKLEDRVREVSFKKVSTSVDLEIYYASRNSLEDYGIDFSNTKQIFAWPSAFEDKKKYCKVPANYRA